MVVAPAQLTSVFEPLKTLLEMVALPPYGKDTLVPSWRNVLPDTTRLLPAAMIASLPQASILLFSTRPPPMRMQVPGTESLPTIRQFWTALWGATPMV